MRQENKDDQMENTLRPGRLEGQNLVDAEKKNKSIKEESKKKKKQEEDFKKDLEK